MNDESASYIYIHSILSVQCFLWIMMLSPLTKPNVDNHRGIYMYNTHFFSEILGLAVNTIPCNLYVFKQFFIMSLNQQISEMKKVFACIKSSIFTKLCTTCYSPIYLDPSSPNAFNGEVIWQHVYPKAGRDNTHTSIARAPQVK